MKRKVLIACIFLHCDAQFHFCAKCANFFLKNNHQLHSVRTYYNKIFGTMYIIIIN